MFMKKGMFGVLIVCLILSVGSGVASTYSSCAEATDAGVTDGLPCTEVSGCGDLNAANTYYLVMHDIKNETRCFDVKGNGAVLDLNGYTITYANSAPVVIPNNGFEGGAAGWDLSGANSASVTTDIPSAKGYWHKEEIQTKALKFSAPTTYQVVYSDPISLEIGKPYTISFLIYSDNIDVASNTYVSLDVPITEIPHSPYTHSYGCYTYSSTDVNGSIGKSAYYSSDFMNVWGAAGGFTYMHNDNSHRCIFTVENPNPRVRIVFAGLPNNTHDVYIDSIEVKPAYEYGIRVSDRYWNPTIHNVKVKNGNIVQGAAGTYYSEGVSLRGTNHEVSNVNVTIYGPDSLAIPASGGGNLSIHDNIIHHNSKRTHYSHDPAGFTSGIYFKGVANGQIYNNNIVRAANGMTLMTNTKNVEVFNNSIDVISSAIHSYAIVLSGFNGNNVVNITVHDNFINTTQGSGIFLEAGSEDAKVFNNYIEVRDGPQEERGWTGKALWQRACINTAYIYNNTFIGYGGLDSLGPGIDSSIATVRLGAADECETYFYDNYVEAIATAVDPSTEFVGICASALDLQRQGDKATEYIYNNILKSNHRNIAMGHYDGNAWYSQVHDNILIKSDDALPEYSTVYYGYAGGLDNIFLNNTGHNGADIHDMYFWYLSAEPRDTNISWFLEVEVYDGFDPADDAIVDITDNMGTTITEDTINGKIIPKALTEVHLGGSGSNIEYTYYAPYNITVTYNGEMQSQETFLTESDRLIFTFESGPCEDGTTRQCGVGDIGACQYGDMSCVDGTWTECVGNIDPVSEICTNGIDDDCDGKTDYDDTSDCTAPVCSLPYDLYPCDCIDFEELLATFNGWYADQITIPQLIDNIRIWKDVSC